MSSKFWTLSEKSKKWFINLRNIVKGAVYAVITGVLMCITSNTMETISWKLIGWASLSAFCSYILVKFPQNEAGNLKK